MKRVMLIGGTDSSGGAGLTRDIAVAHELGCHAKPVVTCVTAQTDTAVHVVHQVPADVIGAQISAALAESRPQAIKIGMVGNTAAAGIIAETLSGQSIPVILDPVLASTSGGRLSEEAAIWHLIAFAQVLTPNLGEAASLCDSSVARSVREIAIQARILRQKGAQAVLVKGGHGRGRNCCDHLFEADGHHQFCAPRLPKTKRGTGCSLATALACEIAGGAALQEACGQAKAHIQELIAG